VTPTGYTAVVEPSGRVLKRTTLGRQQVLEAVVARETGRTVYVTVGDLPVFLAAILAFVVAAALARRRSPTR
jgi:apolipoprotein N-acyltransferase